mmetsp:Transcript_46297/g.75571  ORF Transcript_46297/g.75571 Transcript_46297/m.75571 type:complete len:292 (-) Transcript_46297:841-1716(-)
MGHKEVLAAIEVDAYRIQQKQHRLDDKKELLLESFAELEDDCSSSDKEADCASPLSSPSKWSAAEVGNVLDKLHDLERNERREMHNLDEKWQQISDGCRGDYERVFSLLCEYKHRKKVLQRRFERQRCVLRSCLNHSVHDMDDALRCLKRTLGQMANERDALFSTEGAVSSAAQQLNQKISITKKEYEQLEAQCDAMFMELEAQSYEPDATVNAEWERLPITGQPRESHLKDLSAVSHTFTSRESQNSFKGLCWLPEHQTVTANTFPSRSPIARLKPPIRDQCSSPKGARF